VFGFCVQFCFPFLRRRVSIVSLVARTHTHTPTHQHTHPQTHTHTHTPTHAHTTRPHRNSRWTPLHHTGHLSQPQHKATRRPHTAANATTETEQASLSVWVFCRLWLLDFGVGATDMKTGGLCGADMMFSVLGRGATVYAGLCPCMVGLRRSAGEGRRAQEGAESHRTADAGEIWAGRNADRY